MGFLDLNTLPYIVVAFLVAVTIHELMHGLVAYKLGDPTARNQGRLTLNPIKHLDPWGTIAIIVAGIGWAKPVVVNPHYFANPKRDMVFVGLAGPAANFLVAFLVTKLYLVVSPELMPSFVSNLIAATAYVNVMLGVFNLLPIPPLDGSKVVPYFLPEGMLQSWWKFEQYGFVILLLIMFMLPGGFSFISVPIKFLLPFVYLPVPTPGMI